jgi:hypothetical protein
MTQYTSGSPASAGPPNEPPTRVAREQVGAAGQRVADTASDQATQVAREARRQARDLFGQAREQATEQARTTQKHAAEGLRSLAGELHEMAESGGGHGPATGLAEEAADRLGGLAEWLDRRQPGDLVEEVRRLGRRRPGAFLLGAAAAGVLAGRLTRGTVDAKRNTGGHDTGQGEPTEHTFAASGTYAGSAPPVAAATPPPMPPPAPAGPSPAVPLSPTAPPPPPVPPTAPPPGYPTGQVGRTSPGAPARPDIPARPDGGDPASAPPPPWGSQTVSEYVEDLHGRGESRAEGTR